MNLPKMPRKLPGATALVFVLTLGPGVVPSTAQESDTTRTIRLTEDAPRPTASILDVSWLAGRWLGQGLGATTEEVWLPPTGGTMVGVLRLVRGDSVDFYELVTLVEEEGSLVLRLKHFGPDLVGWEAKGESASFPLVRRQEESLWFDGLTIHRLDEDEMEVWVALQQQDESIREARFTYRRVP